MFRRLWQQQKKATCAVDAGGFSMIKRQPPPLPLQRFRRGFPSAFRVVKPTIKTHQHEVVFLSGNIKERMSVQQDFHCSKAPKTDSGNGASKSSAITT
jgi:hypothetical protein